ncbi:MAG: hypothetical protein IJS73_01395 [Paludibacteraceae bacterium]|nr:hypothetical protein [Paludibacteraceae bacterium]
MKKLFFFFALAVMSAMVWGAKYTLVSSLDDLQSGDKIVIACQKKGVVAGALNGTNMPSVSATFADDLLTLTTTEAYEYTILGGGTNWVISFEDGYIGCTSAKNSLTTDNTADKYSSNWVVEELSEGDIKYLCKSNNYENTYLQYNSSAKYFSNYASKQTAIQFYKKVETTAPTIECQTVVDFGKVVLSEGSFSAQKQLAIAGQNLTETIKIELTEGADAFSIDKQELPAEGGEVNIVFSASESGDYAGVMRLSSGAVVVNVSLTAEAVDAGGSGTKDSPFSCADVINQNNDDSSIKAWVVGYILGCATTKNGLPAVAATINAKTNIAIADDLDGNDIIAVALPSGEVQDALNLQDNAELVGRRVKVYGSLVKYFGGPGMKNTSDYELLDDTPTALEDILEQEANIKDKGQVRKVFENGQIYILLPDGRKINTLGVEMR